MSYLEIDDPDLKTKLSLLRALQEDLVAWDGVARFESIFDKHPMVDGYFWIPPQLKSTPEYRLLITKDDVRRVLTNYPPELFPTDDIFRWACLMFDSNSIDCDLGSTRDTLQQLTMGGGGFDEEDRRIALGMLEP